MEKTIIIFFQLVRQIPVTFFGCVSFCVQLASWVKVVDTNQQELLGVDAKSLPLKLNH